MTGPKLTLLLADDHEIIREGIASFCRSRPDLAIVRQCSDGEQALAAILSDQPDFAVIGPLMQRMAGNAVIRTVRETACPTRIIVLSTDREDAVIQELFSAGADGY